MSDRKHASKLLAGGGELLANLLFWTLLVTCLWWPEALVYVLEKAAR